MADCGEGWLKKFSKVSSGAVYQAAQNLGIDIPGYTYSTSTDVSRALVDDVSFRIRHVTDIACQFMHHAKHKRMTTDDFDKALKWSRVEPLHGHQTGQASTFCPTQNSSVFVVPDDQIDLTTTALADTFIVDTLPDMPRVEASWVAVEGATVSSSTSVEHGQPYVELQRGGNEVNEKYLCVLMEALTGDQGDIRMVALTDLQKNSAIANILPDMVAYLQETLCDWNHYSPCQLTHLLKLCLALFQNPHLYLEPYLSVLYPRLKALLLDSSYLVCGEDWEHWSMRELAAVSLATLLHRCSPLSDSLSDLHSSLRQLLLSPGPPLPSLYGALLTLAYLPGDCLVTILYPRIEELVTGLSTQLEGKLDTTKREDILRVYETLLLCAELLLTSGYQLEQQQTPPTPPPPPEPKPTLTSPPKEPGNLFANTSFELSSEPTDMEIEHSSTQTDSAQLEIKNEQKTPSLYDQLIELFGESLLLRLSALPQFMAPPQASNSPPPLDLTHKRNSHTSPSLLAFLSEEGFKSFKVELPLATPLHPPKRNSWTLTVPKTKMPVSGNVLEQKSREAKHKKRDRRERRLPQTNPTISKGLCASYRRHNSRSGLGFVGIQSAWL